MDVFNTYILFVWPFPQHYAQEILTYEFKNAKSWFFTAVWYYWMTMPQFNASTLLYLAHIFFNIIFMRFIYFVAGNFSPFSMLLQITIGQFIQCYIVFHCKYTFLSILLLICLSFVFIFCIL